MIVNHYKKVTRGVEAYTFTCYTCGTARINTYRV